MFRDDRQASRAIRVLLGAMFHDVDALWTKDGPTTQALGYLKSSPLSHGEHIFLQIAFDFWNGGGGAKFVDILGTLDREKVAVVFAFVRSYHAGGPAIDQWIAASVPPGKRFS
jgi:hypothetical protein